MRSAPRRSPTSAPTLTVTGAVPARIPFFSTFATQLGGSFVNRIVPARLGGMAINVRYLQKQGLDLAVASSSVGLQQLSGLLMHVTLSFVFLLWAGRSGVGAFALPALRPDGADRAHRRPGALRAPLPAARRARRAAQARAAAPAGVPGRASPRWRVGPSRWPSSSAARSCSPLCYIAALVFSVHAFGATGVSVASIGVVFLIGSAISSAAPTPGGIGAVEAALIAGLTAVGIEREVAVPAVFLYRIATFWLPILPGWIAFALLQRRGDL